MSSSHTMGRLRNACTIVLCMAVFETCAGQLAPIRRDVKSASANEEKQKSSEKTTVVARLGPGASVKQRIAGGSIHSYRVMLARDQFLHVSVNQREIDIVAIAFDPAGNQLQKMNRSKRHKEHINLIAESPGSYRIEVSAADKQAVPGTYQIKVEGLRAPNSLDRKRSAIERHLHAAARLSSKSTPETLRAALKEFEEARRLTNETGDHDREGSVLERIGRIHRELGQTELAIQAHLAGADVFRKLRNRFAEAAALTAAGSLYLETEDKLKALDLFSRALPLCDAPEARSLASLLHTNLGTVYDSLGEKQKAIDYLELSLSLSGKEQARAATLNNLGKLYSSTGDNPNALRYFEQALPKARERKDQYGEAVILTHLGNAHLQLGDPNKALEYYDRALPLRRAVKDKSGLATTLANIANANISLGENRKALDVLNDALSLMKEDRHRQGEAVTLFRMGLANEAMGEAQTAIDAYQSALKLSRLIIDQATESAALHALSRVNRKRGDLPEARANIEAALEIVESVRSKFRSPEMRALYLATADDYYDSYIDLLMQLDRLKPDQVFKARALHASERRRARSLLEMLAETSVDIRQGVDPRLLDQERSLKARIDVNSARYAKLQGQEPEQQQTRQLKQEIDESLTEYRNVQGRIRATSPRYAALTMPRPFVLEEIQQEVLDDDTLLLEYSLGQEHSYLWLVGKGSLVSFELPKKAEIEKAAHQIIDSFADSGRAARASGNAGGSDTQARAKCEYLNGALALSRMILLPAVQHLGNKRLLIVADGALSMVPFAALPIHEARAANLDCSEPEPHDARPLISEHEIVIMPSASTLGVLRRELDGRAVPARSLAVFADPVYEAHDHRVRRSSKRVRTFGHRDGLAAGLSSADSRFVPNGRLSRLLFSRREAEEISSIAPPGGTMKALDFKSSKTAVLHPTLKQYRIIHFATHSLLNEEHPGLSGIVMSLFDRRGNPRDGFVRLLDIYNMALNADLVVLSGCQTALGKTIRAEGLVGLTRGFMYAGAARIVASLWNVDDEATTELMKRFYQAMFLEGQRPGAALRTAQLWMQRQERWRSPNYWAAFVLQGEWR